MRYLIVLTLVLATLFAPPQSAFACSGGPDLTVEALAVDAEVIAVGTLVNSTGDVITLQVEEYLKGSERSPELALNNMQLVNDDSCRVSFHGPNALVEGLRVFVFLTPDEFGVASWRPAGLIGQFIFKIPADPRHDMVFFHGEAPLTTLDAARRALEPLYGPAAPPEGLSGGGSGGGASGSGGGVVVDPGPVVDLPGGVVDPGPVIDLPGGEPGIPPAEPTLAPINGFLIDPLPPDRGRPPVAQGQGANPVASGAQPPLVPRLLLGVLVTITALLALWAAVQAVRRRSAEQEV